MLGDAWRGRDIHRWHSCGGRSQQLTFASFAAWKQTWNPHLGSAPPRSGLGLTTGSRGGAEAGTAVAGWYPGMWLMAYELLKCFFQFCTICFLGHKGKILLNRTKSWQMKCRFFDRIYYFPNHLHSMARLWNAEHWKPPWSCIHCDPEESLATSFWVSWTGDAHLPP